MWSVVADLGVFFLGILGLGALVEKVFAKQLGSTPSLISSLILGQILIYLAWLGFVDVKICFLILKFTAVFGIWALYSMKGSIAFVALFFFLGFLFLASPVEGWDERFVWVYNAKVLHAFSGDSVFKHLLLPEVAITHPDNPKLYAVLAALVGSGRPWSAYYPKIPMILLWLPCCLIISKLALPKSKRVFIALLALTCCGQYTFTTYMDPLLAMNALVGGWALFFDRRLKREAILLLSLAPLIKVEGVLITTCLFGAYGWLVWREKRWKQEIPVFAWVLPALICFVAWKARCLAWGLESYYVSSQGSFLSRFLDRALVPHQYWVVLRSVIQANRILFDLILIAGVYRYLQSRRLNVGTRYLVSAMLLYLGCLFLIYFGTPFDMAWHIHSSIDRTTLPFYILTLGALVLEAKDSSNLWQGSRS